RSWVRMSVARGLLRRHRPIEPRACGQDDQDAGWRVRNCGGIQSTAGVSRVTRPGTVPFETLLSGRDRIQSIRPNIRITATVEPTATVAWSLGRGGRSIPMQRDV